MRSSIHLVDVDRLETWTRYRAGLCDSCAANRCTMPVEFRLPDLVSLGLVDAFEAEHEEPRQIARRLVKGKQLCHVNDTGSRHLASLIVPGQRRSAPRGRRYHLRAAEGEAGARGEASKGMSG